MYNMVAAYIADGQYQPALDELKTWREQGKRETAESYAIEGNATTGCRNFRKRSQLSRKRNR